MNRTDKEQLVTELTDKIKGAKALYYTDFTGLNVKRMTELRRRLRRAGVDYVVIKNTLALRAVNESGLTGTRLRGPTGVVIGKVSFGLEALETNFSAFMDQIVRSKPSAAKGVYVRTVSVSSTMGPGVAVDTTPYR